MVVSYVLFVGSRPGVNDLEPDKIKDILRSRHNGYFILGIAESIWGDKPQETLVIAIADLEAAIEETVELLKTELELPFVAAFEMNDMTFM